MTRKSRPNRKIYKLRGYVTQRGERRFVAVCLKPNLVFEGSTQREAMNGILRLIRTYAKEAAQDGQLDHFMATRAPLRFHFEYATGRIAKLMNHSFKPFKQTCCIPQHA